MNSEMCLTIVMVAGPGDEELVRQNIEHIARKNPDETYEVHILDNGCFHGHPPLSFDFANVSVHLGEPPDPQKPNACRGSYQHSSALNRFLREHEIQSSYLLILDPDFYIVRENWISDVINHMSARKLVFFGAPWHPKWYSKYRYFPCVHCMFIDAMQIDCCQLNFTPDLVERGAKADKRNGLVLPPNMADQGVAYVNVVPRKWIPVFMHIVRMVLQELCHSYAEVKQPIPRTLKFSIRSMHLASKVARKIRAIAVLGISMSVNRRIIGSAYDTGYLVERQFAERKQQVETLVPSVILLKDFTKPQFLAMQWGKRFEALVPDRWSYIPKRQNYFTETSFKQYGLPDTTQLGWEEFFWSEEPWGVHMRRYNKTNRDTNVEMRILQNVVNICQ